VTREPQRAGHEHFVRGLGESTRHNALAYGYSLTLTGAFGLLTILDRKPHVLDVFLFGIGGSITFAIANAAVTRGFRVRIEREPPIVLAFGSSFGVVSVCGSLGAAALVAWGLHGWPAWLVGPFACSGCYLVLSALEFVLARAARAVLRLEHLQERG
jgi:MFS family permease